VARRNFGTLSAILVSAAIALVLAAADTGQAEEITLPGADQGLPTLPPCKASKKVACVPLTSPAKAARRISTLTSNAKVRRGLGLPPLKKLFGRRGAAKARKADAKFAKKADDTLFAGASSAGQFGGGDELGQSLGADQALRNGKTQQKRDLHMDIAVDQCPDPGPIANSHGQAKVRGRAFYRVVSTTQKGHFMVTTIVTLTLQLKTKALVNRRAAFFGIDDFGGHDIDITQEIFVHDLRTGSGPKVKPLNTSVHINSIDPANGGKAELELQTFNAFIKRQEASEKGEPNPYRDSALFGDAIVTAGRTFAMYVGSRILEVTHEAEKNWTTPNACVKLTLTAPSDVLGVSKTVRISGAVKTTSVPASEAQIYSVPSGAATFNGDLVNGGSSQTIAKIPLAPGMPWVDYTAPATQWTAANKPGVKIRFYSKAGVAEEKKLFDPELEQISGSFTELEEEGGSTYEWAGKADFERSTEALMGGADGQYKMTSGTVTGTASGSAAALGAPSCSQSGSGQFALSPADSVFLVLPRLVETDPYPYTFTIQTSVATEYYEVKITCPDPKENTTSGIPTTFTVSPLTVQYSADGKDFSGSETIEEGLRTIKRTWSFHAKE
jgi:hypothetical protein